MQQLIQPDKTRIRPADGDSLQHMERQSVQCMINTNIQPNLCVLQRFREAYMHRFTFRHTRYLVGTPGKTPANPSS